MRKAPVGHQYNRALGAQVLSDMVLTGSRGPRVELGGPQPVGKEVALFCCQCRMLVSACGRGARAEARGISCAGWAARGGWREWNIHGNIVGAGLSA